MISKSARQVPRNGERLATGFVSFRPGLVVFPVDHRGTRLGLLRSIFDAGHDRECRMFPILGRQSEMPIRIRGPRMEELWSAADIGAAWSSTACW